MHPGHCPTKEEAVSLVVKQKELFLAQMDKSFLFVFLKGTQEIILLVVPPAFCS